MIRDQAICKSSKNKKEKVTTMELSYLELLDRLQNRDECTRIEAKQSRKALGKSVLETISAFSNEAGLGGGYLVLGLKKNDNEDPEKRYTIQGVDDPDKIQQELAGVCRNNFNIPISPEIIPEHISGKTIIIAFISEAWPMKKPVYIKKDGREKGAFRRIGSADYLCTNEDIDLIYQLRSDIPYEDSISLRASWNDIDEEAIEEYRSLRKKIAPESKELLFTDQELLESLGVLENHNGKLTPTMGGMLLFGSKAALRRTMPMSSRVDYILAEGTEWVEDPSRRFHAIEFREPLIFLINRLHIQIMYDLPKGFYLKPGSLQRTDIPLIPGNVIREALANTLMHRDYRVSQPTQIIRYANRLEFRNAGYSLKPIKKLGTPGSLTRNERIAATFLDLHIGETKGTGIRAMKTWMKEAGLTTPPIFESSRESNDFNLILLPHHLMDKEDLIWLQQFESLNLKEADSRALVLAKELGAITNEDYRQLNGVDTLVASSALRHLRDLGLLIMKGSGNGTYYKPAPKILGIAESHELSKLADVAPLHITSPDKDGASLISSPDKDGASLISSHDKGLCALPKGFPKLPKKLEQQIIALGQRTPDINELKEIIRSLCFLSPLKKSELAKILDRKPKHLSDDYLSEMIQSKELIYLYPDNLTHPQQAYKTPDKDNL
jgi:ATP-dependent DNA helicase RecG